MRAKGVKQALCVKVLKCDGAPLDLFTPFKTIFSPKILFHPKHTIFKRIIVLNQAAFRLKVKNTLHVNHKAEIVSNLACYPFRRLIDPPNSDRNQLM